MTPVLPLALGLGPPEIILIILVVVLLFGAKKLPELARGSGRALRIFKAETKGLLDDDDDDVKDTREDRGAAAARRPAPRRGRPAPRAPVSSPSAEQPVRRRGAAAPRHRALTARSAHPTAELTCPSPESSGCSAPGRRTPSAPTGGWRSRDHLRELRARLLRVGARAGRRADRRAVLLRPAARADLRPVQDAPWRSSTRARNTVATINGVGGPLLLQLKLCGAGRRRGHQPLLALPDLGLHRARPARPREALDPDLRRDRRAAVPRRRRGRLLRAAQGPRGADRLHPGRPDQPGRLRGVLLASSPGCCWSSGSRSRSRCSWCC